MPDAKYFDRSGNGVAKNVLGSDNEDMPMSIKPGGVETPTMAMPSESTQDKPVNQDGNSGKPFFKTLESRRGKSSSGNNTPGSFGGPNSQ